MKKAAVLAVTHGGMDEDDSKAWDVTPVRTLNGSTIHPKGNNALLFMAKFDIVFLWHWPSPFMVDELAKWGTAVVPFVEVDAVKPYQEWGEINEQFRQMLSNPVHDMRIKSDTMNRFGHPFVDYYESGPPPWNRKPHVHAIDHQRKGYHVGEIVVQVLRGNWDRYRTKPAAIAYDAMDIRRYYGTASNVPDGFSEVSDWGSVVFPVNHHFCPVWAHTGGSNDMTPYCLSEHGLRDWDIGECLAQISRARALDSTLGLAPEDANGVAKLRQLISLGYTPDVVQMARSGGLYITDDDLKIADETFRGFKEPFREEDCRSDR